MHKIINIPIYKIVLVIGIAFVLNIIFSVISLYLSRLEMMWYPSIAELRDKSALLYFIQVITGDLRVLSRYVIEAGVILLIVQSARYVARKISGK